MEALPAEFRDEHLLLYLANAIRIEITEQPDNTRFRYMSEGRTAGTIYGVKSNGSRNPTFPTIKVEGDGVARKITVIASCVTVDGDNQTNRPHPHKLVGNHCRSSGVWKWSGEIKDTVMVFMKNVGIQSMTREQVVESLMERRRIGIDPCLTGFSHINDVKSIMLKAVRICFQVFVGKSPIAKAISDIVQDTKSLGDLQIVECSECSAPVTGGKKIILLCKKFAGTKEDIKEIKVIFYETKNVVNSWSSEAEVVHTHYNHAFVILAPQFKDPGSEESHEVFIKLRKESNEEIKESQPIPFEYTPWFTDPAHNVKYPNMMRYHLKDCHPQLLTFSRNPSIDQVPLPGPSHAGPRSQWGFGNGIDNSQLKEVLGFQTQATAAKVPLNPFLPQPSVRLPEFNPSNNYTYEENYNWGQYPHQSSNYPITSPDNTITPATIPTPFIFQDSLVNNFSENVIIQENSHDGASVSSNMTPTTGPSETCFDAEMSSGSSLIWSEIESVINGMSTAI